jgi:hypothetical protein
MSWLRFAPAVLLLTAACAGFPLFWKEKEQLAETGQGEPSPGRATLEFQAVHYDGESLSGRLLLGAESGVVRLKKRLMPRADIHVNSIVECGSNAPVSFIMADVIPAAAHEEDLLLLSPGYWYGSTVRFKLFSERFTGLGLECIEAELTVFSFEGKPLASTRVRAERFTTDGGVPDGPPASADAGTQ